jgi:hypothetical protein
MKRFVRTLLPFLALVAVTAHADWHGGKVTQINIAYDGSTITFAIAGHSRNNCSCYSAWPSVLCLDRSRISFKEEVAMLYSARARGTEVFVNIDETSCEVVAMYEAG